MSGQVVSLDIRHINRITVVNTYEMDATDGRRQRSNINLRAVHVVHDNCAVNFAYRVTSVALLGTSRASSSAETRRFIHGLFTELMCPAALLVSSGRCDYYHGRQLIRRPANWQDLTGSAGHLVSRRISPGRISRQTFRF